MGTERGSGGEIQKRWSFTGELWCEAQDCASSPSPLERTTWTNSAAALIWDSWFLEPWDNTRLSFKLPCFWYTVMADLVNECACLCNYISDGGHLWCHARSPGPTSILEIDSSTQFLGLFLLFSLTFNIYYVWRSWALIWKISTRAYEIVWKFLNEFIPCFVKFIERGQS